MRIGVLNVGSATAKTAVADVTDAGSVSVVDRRTVEFDGDRGTVMRDILRELSAPGEELDAFAHRIVHGGRRFTGPCRIDAGVETVIEELADLAPAHNPAALEGIRAAREIYPDLPEIGVFDTTFHWGREPASRRYPLPDEVVEEGGYLRYGFHGIAHASLVESLAGARETDPEQVDAVTLQLGSGCSACAVRGGESIETSMGYTPDEGLMMATRSGDVGPGVVVELIREGRTTDEVESLLNERSGLLGVGGSADMRELLEREERGDRTAALAVRMFVRRVVERVGAYWTLLDGRGALVFGGGIGTNSPEIRRRVAAGLGAWDVRLAPGRNEANEPGRISREGTRPVYAFRTDEERLIAREGAAVLRSPGDVGCGDGADGEPQTMHAPAATGGRDA